MSLKTTYKIYKTGSLSGTMIHDVINSSSEKFTYIKVTQKKSEQVFYLDRNLNLVDASQADIFSLAEAHKISSEKMKLPKNYTVSIYSSTKKLNDHTRKVAEEEPNPRTSQRKATTLKKKPAPFLSRKPSPSSSQHVDRSSPPQIFIGMAVSHKQFGDGEIVKIDKRKTSTYIRVAFPNREKSFGYPHCFENGFLEKKA